MTYYNSKYQGNLYGSPIYSIKHMKNNELMKAYNGYKMDFIPKIVDMLGDRDNVKINAEFSHFTYMMTIDQISKNPEEGIYYAHCFTDSEYGVDEGFFPLDQFSIDELLTMAEEIEEVCGS